MNTEISEKEEMTEESSDKTEEDSSVSSGEMTVEICSVIRLNETSPLRCLSSLRWRGRDGGMNYDSFGKLPRNKTDIRAFLYHEQGIDCIFASFS